MHSFKIFNKYLLCTYYVSCVVLVFLKRSGKELGLGISALNSDSWFISCATLSKLFNLSEFQCTE